MSPSPETIAVIVPMLMEAYGRKATDATLEAYLWGLDGCSDEQAKRAAAAALRQSREHPPSPGQLRELALTGGIGFDTRAEVAWQEFDQAVSSLGADSSVTFEDGIINATVRTLGGWEWCCTRGGEEYHTWLRKEFLSVYVRLVRDGCSEEMRRGFLGRLAMANVSFPEETLRKLNSYTGQVSVVGTTQPVLLPAAETVKRLPRSEEGVLQIGSALRPIEQSP